MCWREGEGENERFILLCTCQLCDDKQKPTLVAAHKRKVARVHGLIFVEYKHVYVFCFLWVHFKGPYGKICPLPRSVKYERASPNVVNVFLGQNKNLVAQDDALTALSRCICRTHGISIWLLHPRLGFNQKKEFVVFPSFRLNPSLVCGLCSIVGEASPPSRAD